MYLWQSYLEKRQQWTEVFPLRDSGVVKCPMTWIYGTSPKIVAIKKTIYRSWLIWLGDVKHGDMTNDPWDCPLASRMDDTGQ